ncbi:MAG: HEAT repeat domain-containing protein [Cyanobacteria bacterium J06649_5]
MNISEIKVLLASDNSQERLRGLVALKDHEVETAVPLLIDQKQDSAFLVRSFVAMGLGRKQNEAAYSALLEMLPAESDHNVQAEIANSLGLYGRVAVERLVQLFYDNDHWLVRRSILAIMPELESPKELLELAQYALKDKDQTIAQAGIASLGLLADTSEAQSALEALLPLLSLPNWRSRMTLAYALKSFDNPAAKDALTQLRKDEHHKVVAAALEDLLPT